ncbi:MAG: RNA pyrophosphohydrolase [Alphaproteobacteria bacterium]|nr:RNA pyrophosphohydrolase [Alphaproteobacteria bacterium]
MTGVPRDGRYRPCAAILLFERHGRVLVADRIDIDGPAWQLPQGGVDEGETAAEAAAREMAEEIGVTGAALMAESALWRPYDLPGAGAGGYRGKYRGQTLCFVAYRFAGPETEIDIDTAHPEFRAWRWEELEALPGLIVPFKRRVYEEAVAEFMPLRDRIRAGTV